MLTNEQKILNQHAARMEFREKLKKLIMELWDDSNLDDFTAELNRAQGQMITFMGHNAWEVAKKEMKEEEEGKHEQ